MAGALCDSGDQVSGKAQKTDEAAIGAEHRRVRVIVARANAVAIDADEQIRPGFGVPDINVVGVRVGNEAPVRADLGTAFVIFETEIGRRVAADQHGSPGR